MVTDYFTVSPEQGSAHLAARAHPAAPAIGSVMLGPSSGSPNLPRYVANGNSTQYIAGSYPAQHLTELCVGDIPLPGSVAVDSGIYPLHHTAAAPYSASLLVLPFAGVRGFL